MKQLKTFNLQYKMRKEPLKTRHFFHNAEKLLETPDINYDLPSLIDKIKDEDAWKRGELNAKTLLINSSKRVVLTALHPGTEVESYQSNTSISVQIIAGKLKFHTHKKTAILEKGQLLTLYENIKYSLISLEETVLLLTINTGNIHSAENDVTFCISNNSTLRWNGKKQRITNKKDVEFVMS